MNIMQEEKEFIINYMKSKDKNWPANLSSVCKKKNLLDSADYRNKANELYNSKNYHNEDTHEELWSLYTKSIAFAPTNTEALAISYENRSILFFHLKRFKDCIADCNRALEITTSINLKAKLLCRKAESLMLLDEPSVKRFCEQAVCLIEKMLLPNSIKKGYRQKLSKIMVTKIKTTMLTPTTNSSKSYLLDSQINYSCQKEVTCVSESIAIEYDKKWGRHIVAAKKIKPGEIISIEKNFNSQCCLDGQYLFCSHCFKPVFASIPCERCAFDIYCSKQCQQNAFNEYHNLECSIYQCLWNMDDENKLFLSSKFFFKVLDKAGGLDRIKTYLADIENCKDPRKKGFTDGIFGNEDAKSFLSLSSKVKLTDHAKKLLIERSCLFIFFLAKNTSFFGKDKILSKSDYMKDGQVLFAAALFLNIMLKLQCYGYLLQSVNKKDLDNDENENLDNVGKKNINPVVKTYGMSVGVFSGLINHSCDPNVGRFITEDDKTVIYAKDSIKKGSQLFLSYFNEYAIDHQFLALPVRQSSLLRNYGFVCTCAPCKENWPCYKNSLNRLIQTNPEKFELVMEELKKIEAKLQNALGTWKFKIPKDCYSS